MRHLLITLFLCLQLLAPVAQAQATKGPLDISVRQYGFLLGIAVLGGFVSWLNKVMKGELAAANLMHLIGELCTSALAGLLAFFLMQWLGISEWLQPAIVGIAGHMGTKALQWGEESLKKKAATALGISDGDKSEKGEQ